MKIAISASSQDLNGNIADVFGRCLYFIIVEVEDGKILTTEVLKNEGENQLSGAGIGAAQLLANNGVEAVIAKSIGPKALDVLKQFNIEIHTGNGNIEKSLNEFIAKN